MPLAATYMVGIECMLVILAGEGIDICEGLAGIKPGVLTFHCDIDNNNDEINNNNNISRSKPDVQPTGMRGVSAPSQMK